MPLVLAACGGGGGNAPQIPAPPPPQGPTAANNSADVSAAFGKEATVNVLADDNGNGLQVTDVIDGNPLGFEIFSSLDDTPLASQAFFGVFSITPTGEATYRFGSALTASIRGFTPDPCLA